MNMSITKTSPATGAEVGGVDLSLTLDPETVTAIHQALAEHGVLVFRDQQLTPAKHVAVSRQFGSLEIHVSAQALLDGHPEIYVISNVLENGKPKLALGSPGAARITAGLSQVILNVTVFGMNVAEAVVHPRFDAYADRTMLMESRFPAKVVASLAKRGWDIIQSPNPFGVIGRVYAAELAGRDPLRVIAGVDPGASGAAYREIVEN